MKGSSDENEAAQDMPDPHEADGDGEAPVEKWSKDQMDPNSQRVGEARANERACEQLTMRESMVGEGNYNSTESNSTLLGTPTDHNVNNTTPQHRYLGEFPALGYEPGKSNLTMIEPAQAGSGATASKIPPIVVGSEADEQGHSNAGGDGPASGRTSEPKDDSSDPLLSSNPVPWIPLSDRNPLLGILGSFVRKEPTLGLIDRPSSSPHAHFLGFSAGQVCQPDLQTSEIPSNRSTTRQFLYFKEFQIIINLIGGLD